jgi:hypothetical protein
VIEIPSKVDVFTLFWLWVFLLFIILLDGLSGDGLVATSIKCDGLKNIIKVILILSQGAVTVDIVFRSLSALKDERFSLNHSSNSSDVLVNGPQ